MADETKFTRTFVREWREFREHSLEALASMVEMDKSNLGKLERGILQYNQKNMERIAKVLGTSVDVLLTRGPEQPSPLWHSFKIASPEVRRQIELLAATLVQDERR
jgi:transcriptional regulator with XRE-family HTH domain